MHALLNTIYLNYEQRKLKLDKNYALSKKKKMSNVLLQLKKMGARKY